MSSINAQDIFMLFAFAWVCIIIVACIDQALFRKLLAVITIGVFCGSWYIAAGYILQYFGS